MLTYEDAVQYMSSARHIYLNPTPEEIALVTLSKRYVTNIEVIKLLCTLVPVPQLADKELLQPMVAV